MSELGIPIGIEKSEISTFLNAMIINAFGLGMYTIVYFGTMYIYFTRNYTKHYIVPGTITVLFLCNIIQTGVQWYAIKSAFVDNGDTRDSVFVSLLDLPKWVYVSVDSSAYCGFVLADRLLIWRCFIVWNRSFRVISVSLLLIVAEIALFLARIIFSASYGGVTENVNLAVRVNDLLFAAFFTAFLTSFVTTLLIAYRIYSASEQTVSKRRFRRIINIVIQSGAVYSLSILVPALAPVLPGAMNPLSPRNIAFNYYGTALGSVIAGISTTVLVTWISVLPADTTFPSTSIHLSGLQFHARSTQRTDNSEGTRAHHSINVDRNLFNEGLQGAGKVQ